MEAAAIPLPNPDTTPPVMKMYFVLIAQPRLKLDVRSLLKSEGRKQKAEVKPVRRGVLELAALLPCATVECRTHKAEAETCANTLLLSAFCLLPWGMVVAGYVGRWRE